ncbi:MAG: ABC transporter permease [Acidobacteriota bacterium]|nr:ABC transporter permease [Acidobacteriota bacterium]
MNRKLRCGLLLLGVLVACATLADFLSPYDPAEQHREFPFAPLTAIHIGTAESFWRPFVFNGQQYPLRFFVTGAPYRLLGFIPCRTHLFGVQEPARIFLLGSDGLGRDVFSRTLYGARLSLTIAALALLVSIPLALLIGTLSGFYGGWIDFICMRLMELFLALPALYLIIALRSALPLGLEPEKVFLAMVMVIALFGWANLARIVRGATLGLREREFVQAAIALGASDARIIVRHLLPNLTGLILTQAALAAPSYILAEVSLSYLGLGVPEPLPSWGGMLASVGGVGQLGTYWWNLAPGAAIFMTTLAFYLLAEGLREWSDPARK